MNNIEIIYEDDELLAVDKPSGLVVHYDGKTKEPTLASWLLERYPSIRGVGEPWSSPEGEIIERPGIVHRLDRETSGVMVVAKTQESFMHLKKQFKERKVEKTYNAFVYGKLPEQEGVIERPIGKSARDFRQWSAQRGARGTLRDARTEYTVLKGRADASFVEVRPMTGRTHQIRVHFKAIHHPLVCDKLYAPKHECVLDFNRLALHARRLKLKDLAGKTREFESSLPEEFVRACEML